MMQAIQNLRSSDKIRYWIVDYFSPEEIRYGEKMRARFMRNAPFRFTSQDWFGFFASHGWRPREVRYLFDEAKRPDRPVPLPWFWRLWIGIVRSLVSPARRERMNRFAAFEDARAAIIFTYREAVVAQPE